MGVYKNADASYVVGKGITDGSDYKGFDGQKQIVIQLTADGATDSAMDALNYLKTYAINNAGSGLPIKPSAEVLISANGYTKALEADDFEITDDGMKIGGIVYTSSDDSWDFSNAVSGGSGGTAVVELPDSFNGDILSKIYEVLALQSFGIVTLIDTSNVDMPAEKKTAYTNVAKEIASEYLQGNNIAIKMTLLGIDVTLHTDMVYIHNDVPNVFTSLFNISPTDGYFLTGVLEFRIPYIVGAIPEPAGIEIRYCGTSNTYS